MLSKIPEVILSISKDEARKIIEALRRGGVAKEFAEILTVGRRSWLCSVEDDLKFIADGGAKTRFLVASYGGGKTHFLTLVKNRAINNNFVVSYIELQSREAPFDKFEIIFSKLIRQLNTSDGKGASIILDKWVRSFNFYRASNIERELCNISSSIDFRNALRKYLELAAVNTPESLRIKQDVIAWLQGDPLQSSILRQIGIRNRISINNVSEIFSSFINLLKSIGYNGLMLLLDEAEAITSLTISKQRKAANENLRKLLDNTDNNRGLYILFATTPTFMKDPERGARSYPALWDRIKTTMALPMNLINTRSIIMSFGPLKTEELIELGQKIIYIHGISWDWSAIEYFTYDRLKSFTQFYKEKVPDGLVRSYLRLLVDILDVIQQNEGLVGIDSIISNELIFNNIN